MDYVPLTRLIHVYSAYICMPIEACYNIRQTRCRIVFGGFSSSTLLGLSAAGWPGCASLLECSDLGPRAAAMW